MIIISHRGNIEGSEPEKENTVEQINFCFKQNIPVEVDVWYAKRLFLGHDEPSIPINLEFLLDNSRSLFIHCKNIEALEYLVDFKSLNVFFHQNDDCVLTSHGNIWTFPAKPTTAKSIIVCKNEIETLFECKKSIYGICTDYVNLAKNNTN
jgi:hypothetical protein